MKVMYLPTLIENLGYALPALYASQGECHDGYLSMFLSFMSKGLYNSLLVKRAWQNERYFFLSLRQDLCIMII